MNLDISSDNWIAGLCPGWVSWEEEIWLIAWARMELTRNEREVDDIRDCVNENWWTFFEEPGGYRIGVGLLVATVGENPTNFWFSCRPESREIWRCCRWWRKVRRCSTGKCWQGKPKVGYFIGDWKKQICLREKWVRWRLVRVMPTCGEVTCWRCARDDEEKKTKW